MRTVRHASVVAALLAVAACGPAPDAAPRGPAAADSVVAAVAAPPPRLAAAVVTSPDPAATLKVGDTLRTAVALAAPSAGQLQALKSLGTGKYLAYRAGVASYVSRAYRNGALLSVDTLRYAVGAIAPPPVVTPPVVTVSVAVSTECPSAACPEFRVPTTQAASAVVTRGGVRDSTARLAWTIAPAAVCVAQDAAALPGRLRAIAAGSCTITARDSASGVTGARTIVVSAAAPAPPPDTTPTPPPPPPPADTQPTPPPPPPASSGTLGKARLSAWVLSNPQPPDVPPPTRVVRAADAAQLRAALADLRYGDRIELTPGVVYPGPFRWRALQGASGWATLTAPDSALRGVVDSATTEAACLAGRLPVLAPPPGTDPGAILQVGGASALERADGVHLRGLCVRHDDGRFVYNIVTIGNHAVTDTLALPRRVFLDRVMIDGRGSDASRCLALSAFDATVWRSAIRRCHGKGRDAQAINVMSGARFLIAENVLEGWGENFMTGGDAPRTEQLVARDLVFRKNSVTKPLAWCADSLKYVYVIKNLWEAKELIGGLVEDNLFDGICPAGQNGFAVLLKSTAQYKGYPWARTTDVVLRRNVIRRAHGGVSVAGAPEMATGPVDTTARRITLHANDVTTDGAAWLAIENTPDLVVDSNTFRGVGPLYFTDGKDAAGAVRTTSPGLVYTRNRATADRYGNVVASAEGFGVGDAAVRVHAPGAVFHDNIWVPNAAPFPGQQALNAKSIPTDTGTGTATSARAAP